MLQYRIEAEIGFPNISGFHPKVKGFEPDKSLPLTARR